MYESIRRPLKFHDTLNRLRDMKRIKDEANSRRPVIKVQAVWPSLKNDPEKFYNTIAPYVDLIAFNPLIDYLGNDKEIIYENNFSCYQLYQRLVVGADGQVMMCSNDEENSVVVGDAQRQSIFDIWHGDELNAIRACHKRQDGFMAIPVCRKCYLPRATEDGEEAVVNGRTFIIKNYINREQEIGS